MCKDEKPILDMLVEKNTYSIQFPSTLENISLVEKHVLDLIQEHRIKEELFGNIIVALTEIVTNAIVHGNQCDANKKVSLQSCYDETKVSFLVKDEGNGFNYLSIPDPTAPENLNKLSGRGVYIVHQLANEVSFYNNGSSVECTFWLESA